jgi:glycosidase
VTAAARSGYDLRDDVFDPIGPLAVADPGEARLVASAINEGRQARRFPERAVSGGDVMAAALIQEILRLVVARQVGRVTTGPAMAEALERLGGAVGRDAADEVLVHLATEYPATDVYRGRRDAAGHLAASTHGVPHRHLALEELVLLRMANENPAFTRLRELCDDTILAGQTAYLAALQSLEAFFEELPGPGPGGASLFATLRAPFLASPTSLSGQLEYIRSHWAGLLGDRFADLLDRILRTLDVIAEERAARGAGPGRPVEVLGAQDLRATGRLEYERFSEDSSWMPRLVLIAKSTYVWLDQLSKRHGRTLRRLDEIPDEELDRLAEAGITGLWLIGLWERSRASARIKHLRGDPDAVASAYALYDYEIAGDLGGWAGYEALRNRAWRRGIRLASDMVPNHVGIDGRWVIEHPHWFLSLPSAPFPGYSFTGPDLSEDPRVAIQIEDHYWDGTDAAVVFKRHDRATGEDRYLYHGNDGTSMPWNDTAQLDYSAAEVREGVIQTILHVARAFPIIRFDAAMTLAKQHIQRLWFPPPGQGGAIPSRAEHGMSDAEFDAAMPEEFWREVVDRVAAEVPETLLLAEAFWMLEGYFVRTLGMHRVYNSAFMHMMSQEDNAKYRRLVKDVIEFDPEILKRFVNFMSNPDEETAVAQFGKDDKYFGACTLMVTMPGLPMFGHGQIEGFHEKYGMEYRSAKWDEQPDEWFVERHRREIFPLLHRRAQFAQAAEFLLYDLHADGGWVDDDVFAYSNRVDGRASLVVFHNRFAETSGWIGRSSPYVVKATGELVTRHVSDGLGLRAGEHDVVVFREHPSGLEYVVRSREIADRGLRVELRAFEYRVYLDFDEITDETGAYGLLADRLGGRGVPSVAEALLELRTGPLHQALAEVGRAVRERLGEASSVPLDSAFERFAAEANAVGRPVEDGASGFLRDVDRLTAGFPALDVTAPDFDPAWLGVWAAVRALPDAHRDAIRLDRLDLDGADRWCRVIAIAERWASELAAWSRTRGSAAGLRRLLAEIAASSQGSALLRVHDYDGVTWFDRDGYRDLARGLALAPLLAAGSRAGAPRVAELLRTLRVAEERSAYRLERLVGS